jgi:hypothetical protein
MQLLELVVLVFLEIRKEVRQIKMGPVSQPHFYFILFKNQKSDSEESAMSNSVNSVTNLIAESKS